MALDPQAASQAYIDSLGPDALSGALVKTAEYRYPLAGPIEETLFYTHPTVYNRVLNAMEWKAAHPPEPQPAPEPAAPPTAEEGQ